MSARIRLFVHASLVMLIFLCGIESQAVAGPQLNEPDRARGIARQYLDRDDGRTVYREVKLVTCGYGSENGRFRCLTRPVKKQIENVMIDADDPEIDEISLGIITAPSSEKNMAFLQQDYNEPGKSSDQWMYFPAIKKLKRVISQSDDRPKTGSIFGSEIAYEDNEKKHHVNYLYSYGGSESVDSRICDRIIAFPTPLFQPRTSYTKEILWIDRESKLALRRDLYGLQGNLVKTFFNKSVLKTGGVWVNKMMVVINHESRIMSMEKVDDIKVNIPIDPQIVTHRALEDISFRESIMEQVRRHPK